MDASRICSIGDITIMDASALNDHLTCSELRTPAPPIGTPTSRAYRLYTIFMPVAAVNNFPLCLVSDSLLATAANAFHAGDQQGSTTAKELFSSLAERYAHTFSGVNYRTSNARLHGERQRLWAQDLIKLGNMHRGFLFAVDLILPIVWSNLYHRPENIVQQTWDAVASRSARLWVDTLMETEGSNSNCLVDRLLDVSKILQIPRVMNDHNRLVLPKTTQFLRAAARRRILRMIINHITDGRLPVELCEYIYLYACEMRNVPVSDVFEETSL